MTDADLNLAWQAAVARDLASLPDDLPGGAA